uniref:cyclin-P n=1 Tax=Euleptes europaea TaxID=460621 RepID=UPI00253F794E|nr:cyclin-P [Euleptes europaea]
MLSVSSSAGGSITFAEEKAEEPREPLRSTNGQRGARQVSAGGCRGAPRAAIPGPGLGVAPSGPTQAPTRLSAGSVTGCGAESRPPRLVKAPIQARGGEGGPGCPAVGAFGRPARAPYLWNVCLAPEVEAQMSNDPPPPPLRCSFPAAHPAGSSGRFPGAAGPSDGRGRKFGLEGPAASHVPAITRAAGRAGHLGCGALLARRFGAPPPRCPGPTPALRLAFLSKKALQRRGRDGAPQKAGAACPTHAAAAESPPRRAAPLSATLGRALAQAMKRMDMGVEQQYAYDIFRSLMQEQRRFSFRASDVPRAMTAERRALLVDWLVQVHEYLKLADDTLYLAVYLMNAYLRRNQVRVARLQLISITCLFLACKVEERTCPQPPQLCFMMEDSFSPKELLCMERKILSHLHFELHYANPMPLLRLLAEVDCASLEVQCLAMYFMELSLMEADTVGVEPARLSIAALCLAQRVLGEGCPVGSQTPQEDSPKLHTYSESELSVVYPSMARAAIRGPSSTLHATFRKYSRPQKLCASTNPALTDSAYLRGFLGSPATLKQDCLGAS